MVRLLNRRPDVSRAQHREDEGLQESNQQFQRHHEQCQRDGRGCASHRAAHAGPGFAEDEDEAHKTEDHDVTRRDVGKKTEQQREGLEEQSQNLNWGKDEYFEHSRHTGHPQGVFPEVFVGTESRDEEGQQGQHDGDRDVARHVGTAREEGNLPDEVEAEDEEEGRHQVGHILFVLVADVRLCHLVADEGVKRLDEVLEAAWGFALIACGRVGYRAEHEEQDQQCQQHREHVAGDAEVRKTGHATTEDATIIGRFRVEAITLAVDDGVVNGFRFATFFDILVGVIVNFELAVCKLRVLEAHHVAMYQYIAVAARLAIAVMMRVECCRGPKLPAISRFQDDRQVNVQVANDVDGICIRDVVYRVVARIELRLDAQRVPTGAFSMIAMRRFTVFRVGTLSRWAGCFGLLVGSGGLMLRLRVWVMMSFMARLRKNECVQTNENQYNPIFANGCHVHVWKGFFQIGCKGIMRFSLKKTRQNYFSEKNRASRVFVGGQSEFNLE